MELTAHLTVSLLTMSGDPKENRFAAERDEYGADTMSEIQVVGRITLNLWRVMKTEVGFPLPFSSSTQAQWCPLMDY